MLQVEQRVDAPADGRRVRLSIEAILAVAAILVCLLVDLSFIRLGIDVVDEGYFADQAARVLHSEVPYRDFDSLYTPGLLYLNAGPFAMLGGPHIVALLRARFGQPCRPYLFFWAWTWPRFTGGPTPAGSVPREP